jgi:sec-independent protein translocase protein TatB
MFGIGAGEILIILLVTLLVLGPKEIPKVARAIGKAMKDINRFKDELRKSVDLEFEDYEKEDNKIIDNKTQIKDKEDTTN